MCLQFYFENQQICLTCPKDSSSNLLKYPTCFVTAMIFANVITFIWDNTVFCETEAAMQLLNSSLLWNKKRQHYSFDVIIVTNFAWKFNVWWRGWLLKFEENDFSIFFFCSFCPSKKKKTMKKEGGNNIEMENEVLIM